MVASLAVAVEACDSAVRAKDGGAVVRSHTMDALRDEHVELWRTTSAVLPALGPRTGFFRQLANARAARRLVDAVAGEAASLPAEESERRAWRERVCRRAWRTSAASGWAGPRASRRLLLAEDIVVSSARFVREARAFWPALPLDQLGQALRNVWIGNWLQLLRERPVEMRPGLFAYSMLYPLTDNLLDDAALSAADKHAFGRRFGARLAGCMPEAANAREAAVFELVHTIEQEFPRHEYPTVHARLLAIHAAQSQSLRQHHGESLDDAELLALTVAKGGSSVLADLHLVLGRPTRREERFAFGYGVFLQLLDDLQDVEQDLAAGHETLFTRAARQGTLDAPTARLAAFIDRVLDGHGLLKRPRVRGPQGPGPPQLPCAAGRQRRRERVALLARLPGRAGQSVATVVAGLPPAAPSYGRALEPPLRRPGSRSSLLAPRLRRGRSGGPGAGRWCAAAPGLSYCSRKR